MMAAYRSKLNTAISANLEKCAIVFQTKIYASTIHVYTNNESGQSLVRILYENF